MTGEQVSNNTEKEEPMVKHNREALGYEKKPMTLEDLDKGFGIAFMLLFRQKKELEELIESKFAEQNEIIKLILKRLEK